MFWFSQKKDEKQQSLASTVSVDDATTVFNNAEYACFQDRSCIKESACAVIDNSRDTSDCYIDEVRRSQTIRALRDFRMSYRLDERSKESVARLLADVQAAVVSSSSMGRIKDGRQSDSEGKTSMKPSVGSSLHFGDPAETKNSSAPWWTDKHGSVSWKDDGSPGPSKRRPSPRIPSDDAQEDQGYELFDLQPDDRGVSYDTSQGKGKGREL